MSKNKMTGVDSLQEKLRKIQVTLTGKTVNEIIDSTLAVHKEAIKSIQENSGSFIEYKRGNKTHSSSPPGSPPNTDTGRLAQSVAFNIDRFKLEGLVGTNLGYGKDLEYGTRKMMARPWLLPALKKIEPDFYRKLKRNLKEELKKGGK